MSNSLKLGPGLHFVNVLVERLGHENDQNQAYVTKLTDRAYGAILKGELQSRDPLTGAPLAATEEPSPQVSIKDFNAWLVSWGCPYSLSPISSKQSAPSQTSPRTASKVIAERWIAKAQKRAWEIIESQKAKDLYPSQLFIAEQIAREFRNAKPQIVGAGGKPLTGAYIKRHALRGISSEQGKRLSTSKRRGK